jgi:RNA recognition motif-containing protein
MNIYVGNLSFSTTESDLKSEFEAFGNVTSVSIIKDKFSGQSRGFGFIEMPNSEECKAAIIAMNGREIGGRSIKVNEARPKEDRKGGDRRSQRRDRRPPRRDDRY